MSYDEIIKKFKENGFTSEILIQERIEIGSHKIEIKHVHY